MKKVLGMINKFKGGIDKKCEDLHIRMSATERDIKERFTVESTGQRFRVMDVQITLGGEDVTEFMPGNKYGDMENVTYQIKRCRRIWKEEYYKLRFHEIKKVYKMKEGS